MQDDARCEKEPSRTGIHRQVDRLEKTTTDLEEFLDRLDGKIAPLLKRKLAKEEAEKKVMEDSLESQMSGKLDKINGRLLNCVARIATTTDLLDC